MNTMIFYILFFLGLFLMFFFILRGQDILLKSMRNELAQTRAKLHILEMRVAGLLGDDMPHDTTVQKLNLNPNEINIIDDNFQLNLDPKK